MKHSPKPLGLRVLGWLTLIVCLCGAVLPLWDYAGIPLDWAETGFLLLMALGGGLSAGLLLVPLWALYGYFRHAGTLGRQGRTKARRLWLVLVPLGAALLAALGVYWYWRTHQILY